MPTIQNYRDLQLQSTSPRLIYVPENTITLVGTGNTLEVRGANTHPTTITITAVPQGHLINQACSFSLIATTGHTLDVPSVNTAVITGNVNGSDIITLKASITYQGLTYNSTYTINKIASKSFTSYEVTTSSGSLVYDPDTTSYIPTSITINAITTDNGITYTPYSGRFTIHVSTDGGTTWGTAQYTSSINESSYTYNLTGVTEATNRIRFRLHTAGETPSISNILDSTIIPMIHYGYTGSESGGRDGRAVHLYIGSNSIVSVYGNDGYLASSITDSPISVLAITSGFTGSQYYRWLLNTIVVSDWNTTNSDYTYYRPYVGSTIPQVLKVEVGDGYSGSNPYGIDYLTFYYASSSVNSVVAEISNEFHTIPFTDDVGTYTNSGTYFWVYERANVLTFNAEDNTYPADNGKYNVEVTYTNISSGGALTGTGTTRGKVPDHINLTAYQATVTLTFRVRKTDGNTEAEIYAYQIINKSSIENNVTVVGSTTSNTFFNGSNLSFLVDFTDLEQVFWPGSSYYAGSITSGGVIFGRNFVGQTVTNVIGSNPYVGSQFYDVITGLPSDPLTLQTYSNNYAIGVACDPMDHPVLFGYFASTA